MNLAGLKSIDSFIHENWALAGLAVLLLILTARHVLIRDCIRAAKSLGKETYKQIMHRYSAQSLSGWLLILASAVLTEALLAFPKGLPLWTTRKDSVLLAVLGFMLGTLLHLRAVHLATVSVLKEHSELERNF